MNGCWFPQGGYMLGTLPIIASTQEGIVFREQHGEWIAIVQNPREKLDWCFETFGASGANKKRRWHVKWLEVSDSRETITIRFRDKEAVALFKLRWV